MAKISIAELNIPRLREEPVWQWYEGDLDEPENLVIPFRMSPAQPPEGDLFVYCLIEATGELTFEGDVAWDADLDEVYAVTILHGSDRYGFNVRLPDLAAEDLATLREDLGAPNLQFPFKISAMIPIPGFQPRLFTVPGVG